MDPIKKASTDSNSSAKTAADRSKENMKSKIRLIIVNAGKSGSINRPMCTDQMNIKESEIKDRLCISIKKQDQVF